MRWFEFIVEKKHHRKRRKHNALVGVGYSYFYGCPDHSAQAPCNSGATTGAPAAPSDGGGAPAA